MAKSSPISMKKLMTIAGVASSLAHGGSLTTREAILALCDAAESGAPPLRLFHAGDARDVGPMAVTDREGRRVWSQLRQKVNARRLDRNPIPPMASTWLLHRDDLSALAAAAGAIPDSVWLVDGLLALLSLPTRSPAPDASPGNPTAQRGIQPAGGRVISPMNTRGNTLKPIIDEAQEQAVKQGHDRLNVAAVWNVLWGWAMSEKVPLRGIERNAIMVNGSIKHFTRGALAERLRRQRAKGR